MRGEIELNVPRHVDIDQVQMLLNKTINASKSVIQKEYTTTFITGFNTVGIGMKTFFFANPQKKTAVRTIRELRITIMEVFKKYGLQMPYPHITLTAE